MDLTNKQDKKIQLIRKIIGFIFIIIGLTGLILPILPGWILIFVGLSLLGVEIYYVERVKAFARDKISRKKPQ